MNKSSGHLGQVLVTLATAGVLVSFITPWLVIDHGTTKESVSIWAPVGDLWSRPVRDLFGNAVLPVAGLILSFALLLWSLRGGAWYLRVGSIALLVTAVGWYLATYVDARDAYGAANVGLGSGFYAIVLAALLGLVGSWKFGKGARASA